MDRDFRQAATLAPLTREGLWNAPQVRAVAIGLGLSLLSQAALAADWGFDQRPARDLALGGAAVAGTTGAGAAWVNPAGLALTEEAEGYVSLGADIQRREAGGGQGVELTSPWAASPVGSANLALRLLPGVAVGLGGVASLKELTNLGSAPATESLSLELFGLGPQVAVNLPTEETLGPIRLGIGYQFTFGGFRRQGRDLELSADLSNFAGLSFGVQSNPLPELGLGFSVSSERAVSSGALAGQVGGNSVEEGRASLLVPWALSAGARYDLDRVGLAVEYGYQDASALELSLQGADASGPILPGQLGGTRDRHLLRLGAEYRLALRRLEVPLRLGYRMQSAAGTSASPGLFGPLPRRLHTLTGGAGLISRTLEVNLAVAYGAASAEAAASSPCPGCGDEGQYSLAVWSLLVDVGYRFQL